VHRLRNTFVKVTDRDCTVERGADTSLLTGRGTDVTEHTRKRKTFSDCTCRCLQLTVNNLFGHNGDVKIRRTDTPTRTFAVTGMFAQQEFKRLPTIFMNLLGLTLNTHPLLGQGCTRRGERGSALNLDHANKARCRRFNAVEMTERGNSDASPCGHLKNGLARFK
jgi:hypothetical protein